MFSAKREFLKKCSQSQARDIIFFLSTRVTNNTPGTRETENINMITQNSFFVCSISGFIVARLWSAQLLHDTILEWGGHNSLHIELVGINLIKPNSQS